MDELLDYRRREIARRANLIRDALSGRDRQDTNQPPQPFVLFGKPIDSTNFDEVLVAAATWGEMQSFLLRPSGRLHRRPRRPIRRLVEHRPNRRRNHYHESG